jgi:putative transcriptional regulator
MTILVGELMNNIKKYRTLAKISQLELSKKVGVARQTINLIENQKYNPSLELCIKIAKALETDLNTLFWIDMEGD